MKILDADRFYDAVNDIYSHDVISKSVSALEDF